MLPSIFLKMIGVCLIAFGIYDTYAYCYSFRIHETFNFFGKTLPANHRAVKVGFSIVLAFYYLTGTTLIIFG